MINPDKIIKSILGTQRVRTYKVRKPFKRVQVKQGSKVKQYYEKSKTVDNKIKKFDPFTDDDEYNINLSEYNIGIIKSIISFLKENNIDYSIFKTKLIIDDFSTLDKDKQNQFYRLLNKEN